MFALRDMGTKQAVDVLCKGFSDKSALFRHEVAFVMGQMETSEGNRALERVLSNPEEHSMVGRCLALCACGSSRDERRWVKGTDQ